jgi:hypothetical protein
VRNQAASAGRTPRPNGIIEPTTTMHMAMCVLDAAGGIHDV